MVSAAANVLPTENEDELSVVVYSNITDFVKVKFEPVGRWFETLHSEDVNGWKSFDDAKSSNDSSEADEEEYEDNSDYLRSLDPKHWKNQDHYAVLCLKKKRYLARDEDIKKAYRKIVLLHHPDKRRSAGENIEDLDHDYYSCITIAYEILGNPAKRRSYDSIDPEFNEDIPSVNNYSKENFFKCFQPVFLTNSRWSIKQHVPSLGNEESSLEEVEKFYNFWYDFESWREFSYLDEEEKEKGMSREERRWIEKQNKATRLRRKKEEMTRIRQLVDNAYACDSRISKFKGEEKKQKLAEKKAKQEAARLKAEAEEKKRKEALAAEKKLQEKLEQEEKVKREKEKKEKEAIKKQLKKERKQLRLICDRNNYFVCNDEEKFSNLKDLDKLCNLLTLETLQRLNSALEESCDISKKKSLFLEQVELLNQQIQSEKEQDLAFSQKSALDKEKIKNHQQWSHEDLQLLVKAVNLFPAGTNNRWEAIATFLQQHSATNVTCNAKEVLAKAKELQKQSMDLKVHVNKNAYENLEKNQKTVTVSVSDQSAPTARFESSAEQQGLNTVPWTSEEQQLFEQAIKTFPASTEERWEKIAQCVPTRSKKDCVRRYKELVELVKAKKAAQATVSQKGRK